MERASAGGHAAAARSTDRIRKSPPPQRTCTLRCTDAISSIDGNYTPFATHVANVPAGASREAAAIEAAYRILAISVSDGHVPSRRSRRNSPGSTRPRWAPFHRARQRPTEWLSAWRPRTGSSRSASSDGFRANVPYTFLPLAPGRVSENARVRMERSRRYIGPATPWMKQFRPFAILQAGSIPRRSSSGAGQRAVGGGLQRSQGVWRRVEPAELAHRRTGGNRAFLRRDQRDGAGPAQPSEAGDGSGPDRRPRRLVALHGAGGRHAIRRVRRMLGLEYLYNFWRPVTAIQHADIDGNDATDADPIWMPQIVTPTHPDTRRRTAAGPRRTRTRSSTSSAPNGCRAASR